MTSSLIDKGCTAYLLLSLFFILTGLQPDVTAEITFNVTYLDVEANSSTGNNIGFDDPTFGATRQSTLGSVFTYINTVVNHTGTVDVNVKVSKTDGMGFLGSAGTFYPISPNGFENGAAFEHATIGTNSNANPDINVTFDFGFTWNSDLDTPTGSEFDLFTVALHEITHGMGFASLVSSVGASEIGELSNPGVFTVFDSFLELGDGTALFSSGGTFTGTTANLISEDVFFDGTNARLGNSGNPIRIFAPTTFNDGSSISHIDSTLSTAVMTPSIAAGVTKREYTTQDIGILADLGWALSASASASLAVPEPSTWAFAILVLCGVATTRLRSSRRKRLP